MSYGVTNIGLRDYCGEALFVAAAGQMGSVELLPVDPIDRMSLEVTADRCIKRRKEKSFANLPEKSKTLEFVFHRILQFGKT